MSGNSTSIMDSTHCFNKAVQSYRNESAKWSEEVLTSLTDKISVESILHRLSANTHFPEEFQIKFNIFLFIY